MNINEKTMKSFFKEASKKLKGDWVLLGGSVLPSLGRSIRPTVDIDIAGVGQLGGSQQLVLMEIAEAIHLPVDAINTAAEFFLRKIKGFEESLVLLHNAKNLKIFRPDVNLFIQLKLSRMSESDLQDCLEFLIFAKSIDEEVKKKMLISKLTSELKKKDHRALRLKQLIQAIDG